MDLAHWPNEAKGVHFEQGYIAITNSGIVRVRIIRDEVSTLTVKSSGTGLSRDEFQYEIPMDEAKALLRLCQNDIIEKKLKKKYSLNNISILVRAIFQTREFEERFLKIGMGYRVIGGTKFYERAEIKDSVAFLRIINQKNDDLAFERIINVPKRSIGDSTVKQLHDWGRKNKKSLEDSAVELLQLNKIKPKTKLGLVKILNMFNKWRSDLKKKKHYELMEIVLDESGYSKMLKDKKDLESEGRLENLKELIGGCMTLIIYKDF